MANEMTITARIAVTNGTYSKTISPSTLLVNQTTAGDQSYFLSVGTSAETVTITDITEGYCFLRNHDAANFVQWGADDTGIKVIGRLRAGEFAVFRMDSTATLSLKADTAACNVEIVVFND